MSLLLTTNKKMMLLDSVIVRPNNDIFCGTLNLQFKPLPMNLPMKKMYNFNFLFENLNLISHDNLNIPSIIEEEIIEELPCHL